MPLNFIGFIAGVSTTLRQPRCELLFACGFEQGEEHDEVGGADDAVAVCVERAGVVWRSIKEGASAVFAVCIFVVVQCAWVGAPCLSDADVFAASVIACGEMG